MKRLQNIMQILKHETCYRNGINPTDALIRLMEDNPYMVDKIFGKEND